MVVASRLAEAPSTDSMVPHTASADEMDTRARNSSPEPGPARLERSLVMPTVRSCRGVLNAYLNGELLNASSLFHDRRLGEHQQKHRATLMSGSQRLGGLLRVTPHCRCGGVLEM